MKRMVADHNKMDAATSEANKAAQRRHDGDSLSETEIYELAHTERTKVESLTALESDLASQDEVLVETFGNLYGAQSVSTMQRDMASLNQARQDAVTMWWRAAENIEDSAKDELNGGSGGSVSDDEVVQEYDESERDDNKVNGLQRIVDGEMTVLLNRLAEEWQLAKTRPNT